MSQATASMQQCIENCQHCQTTCSQMLTETCLAEGGRHVQQDHVKAMLDCVAACQACVDFMSRHSEFHDRYCAACADICRVCADSCEQIGGMEQCVDACRACQESCSAMAA
ncbi:four-helix bundle copper-binding protein [Crateriforma spongiae]|uniref:four-helix bundle copper-binding protein n=1 Tax=Crateriforma spongiae TaxID=2724528 RepID=UPI001444C9DC|nr:four-helix bundle copper-binding protein [Crateriforma spongiae]